MFRICTVILLTAMTTVCGATDYRAEEGPIYPDTGHGKVLDTATASELEAARPVGDHEPILKSGKEAREKEKAFRKKEESAQENDQGARLADSPQR